MSHKLLALVIAHSICQHSVVEECPLPKSEDLECSLALHKLAMVPPAGMFELFGRLSNDAPLRKQGLIAVNESMTHRRKRFEGDAFSVGRFLRTRLSVNVAALGGLIGVLPTEDRPVGPTLEELVLPEEVRSSLNYLLSHPPAQGRCFSVLMKGAKQTGRRSVARAVSNQLGLPLHPCRPYDCPLPGSALLVDALSSFDEEDWSLIQEQPGLVFIRQTAGGAPFDLEDRADLVLDLDGLEVGAMVVFVARKLREAGPSFSACDPFDIARIGATPGKLIDAIERLARESAWRGHSPETVSHLLPKALQSVGAVGNRSTFAEVVSPRLGLKDLCLPIPVMNRFQRVLRSIRGRKDLLDTWHLDPTLVGRAQGICLFHGPSGTGKSLAGEVVATELGLPLWRMQASELESPYIGESESRLHKFFELAKGKPAVLLLDECDSVFADRGRAEGSTRRYVQSLTAAWLRELDQFSGVLILTTNHFENMDPAFERRIQFRVEFPVPDAKVREQIWSRLIGNSSIPGHEALDFTNLAERFRLSGGLIRNAVLNACHRAAEKGSITQEDLNDAAEEEQQSTLAGGDRGMKQIRGFAGG